MSTVRIRNLVERHLLALSLWTACQSLARARDLCNWQPNHTSPSVSASQWHPPGYARSSSPGHSHLSYGSATIHKILFVDWFSSRGQGARPRVAVTFMYFRRVQGTLFRLRAILAQPLRVGDDLNEHNLRYPRFHDYATMGQWKVSTKSQAYNSSTLLYLGYETLPCRRCVWWQRLAALCFRLSGDIISSDFHANCSIQHFCRLRNLPETMSSPLLHGNTGNGFLLSNCGDSPTARTHDGSTGIHPWILFVLLCRRSCARPWLCQYGSIQWCCTILSDKCLLMPAPRSDRTVFQCSGWRTCCTPELLTFSDTNVDFNDNQTHTTTVWSGRATWRQRLVPDISTLRYMSPPDRYQQRGSGGYTNWHMVCNWLAATIWALVVEPVPVNLGFLRCRLKSRHQVRSGYMKVPHAHTVKQSRHGYWR